MIEANYNDARHLIKNGDIVHVYRLKGSFGIKTLMYYLIQFFTGSPIYHSVVAMWMTSPSGTKRLMCVESNIKGGKRIIPLSVFSDHELEVQSLPEQCRFELMEPRLHERVGQQAYGILDFLIVGLKEFFLLDFSKAQTKGQVCSELCADAWIQAGVPLSTSLISPARLKGELIKLGIQPSIKINL